MKSENRKAPRRALRYPAWIELGEDDVRECQLADVSPHGARLMVPAAHKLPDQFVLRLAQHGTSRRKSRVVWRSDTEVGVEFSKESKPRRRKMSA